MDMFFYPQEELLEFVWLPATAEMTADEYKQEGLNYLEAIHKYRPKKTLSDSRELYFPVVPESQAWTNENIMVKGLAIGLNRLAVVLSNDLFTQISVEQLVSDVENENFTSRSFGDREAARKWLTSLK